jgi:hypothetical protein
MTTSSSIKAAAVKAIQARANQIVAGYNSKGNAAICKNSSDTLIQLVKSAIAEGGVEVDNFRDTMKSGKKVLIQFVDFKLNGQKVNITFVRTTDLDIYGYLTIKVHPVEEVKPPAPKKAASYYHGGYSFRGNRML